MFTLRTLFSSSSGNSVLIKSKETSLLVDCGVSAKRIADTLLNIGDDANKISGIVITHEHSDHVKGASVLCKKFGIPLYVNEKTYENMTLPNKEYITVNFFDDAEFWVGDISVTPFEIPHDGASPVGFCFREGGGCIGFATDIGHINDKILDSLKGCDIAYIESNHDVNMLKMGSYPYFLKQRILSDVGHLSNENCGKLSQFLVENGTKDIILGHLSKQNNMPNLAYLTNKIHMERAGILEGDHYSMQVAPSDWPGEMVRV